MADIPQSQQTQEIDIRTLLGVVNETGAYIYTKDQQGCYTYANQLVLDLFDIPLSELLGKTDRDFIEEPSVIALEQNDRRVFTEGLSVECEEKYTLIKNARTHVFVSVKKPLRDGKGNISGLFGVSTDITKRKRLEIDAHEEKEFLDAILNNVDAYIFMKDKNRVFRYANSKFAQLYGLDTSQLVGKKDTEIMNSNIADDLWILDQKVFDSNQKQTGEEVVTTLEGEEKRYLTTKIPLTLNDGTRTSIGISTDITELFMLKEELQRQAITDALTGLYNRRYFNDQCEREFSRCRRNTQTMSIIIIDIDYFKTINDSYGHPVGDLVLKQVSTIYKSCLRKENILCRIGGEEFAVLLPDTDRYAAQTLAERIRQEQENTHISGIQQALIKPTISLGVSSLLEQDNSYNDLLGRADRALYKAKQQGRNQVCVL